MMEGIKRALMFLYGAVYASSIWACCMWVEFQKPTGALVVVPGVMTIPLAVMIVIYLGEH